MTGNTLEQLIDVATGKLPHDYLGPCPDQFDPSSRDRACPACRAIEAALRLCAGADWVLVPRVPTEAMCEAAGDGPIFIEGRMDGNTFIQSTHYDQRYLLDTWERMIAAAPRHEPGEG